MATSLVEGQLAILACLDEALCRSADRGAMILFPLPGGLLAGVTGAEVRQFDGRPMQRIGIVPSIEVRPALAGLRAGRDEVLERALQHAVTP